MHSYILTYSRLKRYNLWELWVLSSRDLNFCIRSAPSRGDGQVPIRCFPHRRMFHVSRKHRMTLVKFAAVFSYRTVSVILSINLTGSASCDKSESSRRIFLNHVVSTERCSSPLGSMDSVNNGMFTAFSRQFSCYNTASFSAPPPPLINESVGTATVTRES